MTASLATVRPADRRRILDRLAELAELDRLIREPAGIRPPEPAARLSQPRTAAQAPP